MRARRRRRSACARGASITTSRTSGLRGGITRFLRCWGTSRFGDYFKKEAIEYAWELVTSEEWFGIPKDRLYVTIFEGSEGVPRDDEAEQFWIGVGVPKERILAFGAKDNFWQMGETGPCGPCSEIFYDMGIEASEATGPDGQKKDLPFGQDDARYVEIWNLVFMQFDRSAVLDEDGKQGYALAPLPRPSRSIRGWGWSGWRRCCRGSFPILRRICLRR